VNLRHGGKEMNKVIIIGRISREPEIKTVGESEKTVMSFNIAVESTHRNSNGEKEVDFIPVSVWGKRAEALAEYMSKGRLVSVSGRIHVRTYDDKEGNRRYFTEVVAEEVTLLDFKKAQEPKEEFAG
jgi:single-strand DNA-binding protein